MNYITLDFLFKKSEIFFTKGADRAILGCYNLVKK